MRIGRSLGAEFDPPTQVQSGHSNSILQPVVEAYPKWQAWIREKQRRLLVIWGKYDLSFAPPEPEAYRRDVLNAEVHVLDAGHFALDTAADEIAALVRSFVGAQQSMTAPVRSSRSVEGKERP